MKLTPSSTARRSAFLALPASGGSPQTPSPVIRMAPNPSRLTVRSPPTSIVPASAALGLPLIQNLLGYDSSFPAPRWRTARGGPPAGRRRPQRASHGDRPRDAAGRAGGPAA